MTLASVLPSLQDCGLAAPPTVCALALVPTVLWGVNPVIVKYALSRGGTPLQAAVVILSVDTVVLWVTTLVSQGTGAVFGLPLRTVGMFAVAGVFGTAIGRIVVYTGIDRLGAAINSAGVATRPLFATVIGVGLLGERTGSLTVVGVAVLTVGLVVLALSKGGDLRGWRRRDLVFPLSAAALFAASNAIRRLGLQASAATALEAVTINETVAVFTLLGYVVARGRTDELIAPRITYGLFALGGVITATGMLSVFAALGHPAGRVVIVDPLIAAAPLFTAVFAYVLLGDVERITRGIAAGATVVVVGAVLVTLG